MSLSREQQLQGTLDQLQNKIDALEQEIAEYKADVKIRGERIADPVHANYLTPLNNRLAGYEAKRDRLEAAPPDHPQQVAALQSQAVVEQGVKIRQVTSELPKFCAAWLRGDIHHKVFHGDHSLDLIEAYYCKDVLFPSAMFSRQATMSAPHVFLHRIDRVNTHRHEETMKNLLKGFLVSWVGVAGAGKSQLMNKIFMDVLSHMRPNGDVEALFFRVDAHLYMLTHPQLHKKPTAVENIEQEHLVVVEHIPNCVTLDAQRQHIERFVTHTALSNLQVMFLVDLLEEESESTQINLFPFFGICGCLFVVSHRHSTMLFKDAKKSSGKVLYEHLVGMMSPDEVLACGRAMLHFERETCKFVAHNAAITDEDDALEVLKKRVDLVGPILRYVTCAEVDFREFLIELPRLARDAIINSTGTDANELTNTPINAGRIFAPVFRDGVESSRITSYEYAVSEEYREKHREEFKNCTKMNWMWTVVSPHVSDLLSRVASNDAEKNEVFLLVLKKLGLDSQLHEFVSKTLLNFKKEKVNVEFAESHLFAKWDLCVDLGAGTCMAEEMLFDPSHTERILSVLQSCKEEAFFDTKMFALRAEQMDEGVLYTARCATHPVFERVYRVGKLVVAMQESRSSPAHHPFMASNIVAACNNLGITADNGFKLLLVYVTDWSNHKNFDGLSFKLDRRTDVCVGAMQWRREVVDASNLPELHPVAHSLLTLIVRAAFYPGMSKWELVPMAGDAWHTTARIENALVRTVNFLKKKKCQSRDIVLSQLTHVVNTEKTRIFDEIIQSSSESI